MTTDFARDARLGAIGPGWRRTDVEASLGTPNTWGGAAVAKDDAEFWKYGDLELYFRVSVIAVVRRIRNFRAAKGFKSHQPILFMRG